MNDGSMGEMPPSTRVRRGFSAATASVASLIMPANLVHPGSISKSQCDLLFGSFQNITASITLNLLQLVRRIEHAAVVHAPANEDLCFRMRNDFEVRATQHRFETRTIWYPPVRRIATETLLDEIHLRKLPILKDLLLPKLVIVFHFRDELTATQHRLDHQQVFHRVLVQHIERQQRMPQVIQNAEKQNQIKLLPQFMKLINGKATKIDLHATDVGRKPRLGQVSVVRVNADDSVGAAQLHLN